MKYYQKLYSKCVFPFFEGVIKKRATATIYNRINRTEYYSEERLNTIRLSSLRKLLRMAADSSPFHRERFEKNGLEPEAIQSIRDLLAIPIMTKSDIRENYNQMICHTGAPIWTKSTGGSTGEPLHFAYTKESYEWRMAMSKRGYKWAGAPPGSKQAYIWGVPIAPIGPIQRLKEELHHSMDRQLYFNCFEFDEPAMVRCLKRLNHFKPEAIIGYTNPLYNFALFINDNSKINFKPQGIICAAEKVHPFQREIIERVFGAQVFNTYGSREFMLIAAECEKHEGLHISAENLIVEIIKSDGTPAKEGETGKIIVTDLHNYGMPFIRYEIGDLGIATEKRCSCGRGLPLITDVVGRSLDMIKTPENKYVPGEFFPHLMKDFSDIRRFQVIQDQIDHLVIKLVPNDVFDPVVREKIDSQVRRMVGPNMHIEYMVVTDIPLTDTGKYRVTISKITGEPDV